MCVNLTKLNEAILRERHDLPTVDHVLGLLGDATTFENAQQFEQVFHQGCSLRRMQGNNSVLLNNNKAAINNILSWEVIWHNDRPLHGPLQIELAGREYGERSVISVYGTKT